jgi:UTP--glucose-1-phosphate uridylyltransferase
MSANRKVTKVVIPVAGLGSRFLPVTKVLPKELLPIVDTPIIHHIVREAVDAGIETIVFVTSRPKILIEDYFDPGDLTSLKLHEAHKEHLIHEAIDLSKRIDIVSVRQYKPEGLGHAVLQAAPVVAGQNFAVILGDDIIRTRKGAKTAIAQCLETFAEVEHGSVVGVHKVPHDQTALYGVADFGNAQLSEGKPWKICGFVEKPEPAQAPSDWALPGRYVFEPAIIDCLRETPRGKANEIQLTDAMIRLLERGPFYGRSLEGQRFDTGNKMGFLIANVAYALDDPIHKEELRAQLKELLAKHP